MYKLNRYDGEEEEEARTTHELPPSHNILYRMYYNDIGLVE